MPSAIHLKKTKSTNSYLKDLMRSKKVAEGTTVYADYQTEGRGQRGNDWESEAGRNLLFSIVLYPTFVKASEPFIISQIVSLAIKDYLNKRYDDVTIKWPNDIYWKDKKICGILIENELMEDTVAQSIVGVGLNVNQTVFKSMAPNPISMRQIGNGQEIDRVAVLDVLRYYIRVYYNETREANGEHDIVKEYKESLYRADGYYTYIDQYGYFEARIKDVEPNGILVLETKRGQVRKYAFREVKFVV